MIKIGDMIMKILLVEPNYKNKYPPMGLMKISTYHKGRGDEVTFYKGVMDSAEFYGKHYDRAWQHFGYRKSVSQNKMCK